MFTTECFMLREVASSLVALLRVILEQIGSQPLDWVFRAAKESRKHRIESRNQNAASCKMVW